jgi:hypothetical protein
MVEEAMGGLWCCLLRGFLYFLRKMQCAVCFLGELDAAAAEDFGPILQDFEGNTTTKDRMSLFLIRAMQGIFRLELLFVVGPYIVSGTVLNKNTCPRNSIADCRSPAQETQHQWSKCQICSFLCSCLCGLCGGRIHGEEKQAHVQHQLQC